MAARTRHESEKTPDTATRNVKRDFARSDQPKERPWARSDFLHDLHKATARITAEIEGNPGELDQIRRAREQVRRGEVHWRESDEPANQDATD